MTILTQTLNTNNVRTISAKSINLHTIGKLIEHSLKTFLQWQGYYLPLSRDCCPKVGWYCDPPCSAKVGEALNV